MELFTNYFKIEINSPVNYFHYNIEIFGEDAAAAASTGKGRKGKAAQPKKDATPKSKKTPKRLNDEVFREVFKKYKDVFQCRILPVFDGEKNFYSTTQFRLTNGNWTGVVQVKDKERIENIRVNITTPEVSHGQNLKKLLSPTDQIMPVELQALDIIMRNGPRLTKISLGPNFFFRSDDQRAHALQFEIGKDIMKYGQFGHYQCAKKTEGGLYYNVDRAMAVFTYGGKLIDAIKEILDSDRVNLSDQRSRQRVEDQIKTLKFNALHLNYKRTFIIHGLSKEPIKNTFFNFEQNGQKQKISVLEYFKKEYAQFSQRYNLDPNLPCVQVGSRNNAKYFPIETCELEHDEVYRRKLDPILQGMVTRKSSQQAPFQRFRDIENHVKTINQDNTINGTNYLQHYGIKIEQNKAKVQGRILDAPRVEYGNGQEVDTQNRGEWDMKGNIQFFKPSTISEEIFYYF